MNTKLIYCLCVSLKYNCHKAKVRLKIIDPDNSGKAGVKLARSYIQYVIITRWKKKKIGENEWLTCLGCLRSSS